MFYLDTSAWLKRYYDEAGSEWVRSLFQKGEFLASATLGLVEAYATLARKRKAREITSDKFEASIKQLERDWANFSQIEFHQTVVDNSKAVVQSFALRGADAIHLGSALYLQSKIQENEQELIFVTADQELLAAAQAAGLATFDPTSTNQTQN